MYLPVHTDTYMRAAFVLVHMYVITSGERERKERERAAHIWARPLRATHSVFHRESQMESLKNPIYYKH